MIYLDTSAIVKLYVKETYSRETSDLVVNHNKAIPLTSLHDLEFKNAVHLKRFRDEISRDEGNRILARFMEHEKAGVYYRPNTDWAEVFERGLGLSGRHTDKTGSRALDILHVALALVIKAEKFLSFDERQLKLAALSGLKVEHP